MMAPRRRKGKPVWIFANDAFVSIVADRDDSSRLLIRARVAGDIERVFPSAEVVESRGTDYRFRAFVHRRALADVLAAQIRAIKYPNFKGSVEEDDRHGAYLEVWQVMNDFGRRRRAAEERAKGARNGGSTRPGIYRARA